MIKQEILCQLEQAWGKLPGWANGMSGAALKKWLERLGWEVGHKELSVRVNPDKVARDRGAGHWASAYLSDEDVGR